MKFSIFTKREQALFSKIEDENKCKTEILEFSVIFGLCEAIPLMFSVINCFLKWGSLYSVICEILDGRALFFVYGISMNTFLKMISVIYHRANASDNDRAYRFILLMLCGVMVQLIYGVVISTYYDDINLAFNAISTTMILYGAYIMNRRAVCLLFILREA